MIYEKFKLPIIDFVERAEEIPNLVAVVLFGSAVTGDVSRKSDIDILLLFDCEHNPEVGKESKIAHIITSDISLKHDLEHSFSLIFANRRNIKEMDPDFLWEVSREGMLVWAKPEEVLTREIHPSLEPYILVKYSTKNLEEKDKRKLLRRLYGKGGLIDKERERISRGVLSIKAERFNNIKKILDEFNVSYSTKKLWLH